MENGGEITKSYGGKLLIQIKSMYYKANLIYIIDLKTRWIVTKTLY